MWIYVNSTKHNILIKPKQALFTFQPYALQVCTKAEEADVICAARSSQDSYAIAFSTLKLIRHVDNVHSIPRQKRQ